MRETVRFKSKPNRRLVLTGLSASALAAGCKPAGRTATSQKYDAEIIVIGAGLSGLYTAMLLTQAGKDVLVLEGSGRIGGRLYTIDNEHGYTEGGGEQVGAGYARIRSTADQLGVVITPYSLPPAATSLHVSGKLVSTQDWPAFSGNPFMETRKDMTPSSALFRLAGQDNPIEDIYSWSDPANSRFDVSARDWLTGKGMSTAEIKAVDHSLNANAVDSYSMLNVYRSLTLFAQDRRLGRSGYFRDGAQTLPKAMAASLPRRVITGQRIKRIDVGDQGVILYSNTGKTFRAARVVSSLPLPVLSRLQINAPLSDVQKRAMSELPYTQIVQIHFRAEQPFWEKDGMGASMWSDGPLERLFAGQGTDGRPNGIFRAWINGTGAISLNSRTDDELVNLCRQELERLRPASEGKAEIFKIVRWTNTNPLAGGAYLHYAPGQVSWAAGRLNAPAGRLYFAGEHLSHLHTGMEGAMESAETAALKILDE